MNSSTNDPGLKDLMELLERNFQQGNPLLEGACLFRGSRLPDQTSGSFSNEVMHGSLLPQVAASYTHSWGGDTSFIGTYPIDREKTRFYSDFGLEAALQGKEPPSYSVAATETTLTPLVAALTRAGTPGQRATAEERLEAVIRQFFYEANIPTRDAKGLPTRPSALYKYQGEPDVSHRKLVQTQMHRVGPEQVQEAKSLMAHRMRNSVAQELHVLAAQPSTVSKALRTLQAIGQTAFAREVLTKHGDKPLNEFMKAVSEHPLSDAQVRLGRFSRMLYQTAMTPDPLMQQKAAGMSAQIAKLDGHTSTFADVVRVCATREVTQQTDRLGIDLQRDGGRMNAGQANQGQPALTLQARER